MTETAVPETLWVVQAFGGNIYGPFSSEEEAVAWRNAWYHDKKDATVRRLLPAHGKSR